MQPGFGNPQQWGQYGNQVPQPQQGAQYGNPAYAGGPYPGQQQGSSGGGAWPNQGVIPTTTFVSANATGQPGGYTVQNTGYATPGAFQPQVQGQGGFPQPQAPWANNQSWGGMQPQPSMHQPTYTMQMTGQVPQGYGIQQTGYVPQMTGQVPNYSMPGAGNFNAYGGYGGMPQQQMGPQMGPYAGPTGYVGPGLMPGQQPGWGGPVQGGYPGTGMTVPPQVAQATLSAAGVGNQFSDLGHAFQLANPQAPAAWGGATGQPQGQAQYGLPQGFQQASQFPTQPSVPQPQAVMSTMPPPAAAMPQASLAPQPAPAQPAAGWMSFDDNVSGGPAAFSSSQGGIPSTASWQTSVPTPAPPQPVAVPAPGASVFQSQASVTSQPGTATSVAHSAFTPPAASVTPAASRTHALDSSLFSVPEQSEPPAWTATSQFTAAAPAQLTAPQLSAGNLAGQPIAAVPAVPATTGPPSQPLQSRVSTTSSVGQVQSSTPTHQAVPQTAIQQQAALVGYMETPPHGTTPAPVDSAPAGKQWVAFGDDSAGPAAAQPAPTTSVPASTFPTDFSASHQPASAPFAQPAAQAAVITSSTPPFQADFPASQQPATSSGAPFQVDFGAQPAVPGSSAWSAPGHTPASFTPAAAPAPPPALPPVPSYKAPLPEDLFSEPAAPASVPAPPPPTEAQRALDQLHVTMVAINTSKTSGLSLQQSLALASAASGSPMHRLASAASGSPMHRLASAASGSPMHRLASAGGSAALSAQLSHGSHGVVTPTVAATGSRPQQSNLGVAGPGATAAVKPALADDVLSAPPASAAPSVPAATPAALAPMGQPTPPAMDGWAVFDETSATTAVPAASSAPVNTAEPAATASAAALPEPAVVSAVEPPSVSVAESVTQVLSESDEEDNSAPTSPTTTTGAAQPFAQIFSPALAAVVAAAAASESSKAPSAMGSTVALNTLPDSAATEDPDEEKVEELAVVQEPAVQQVAAEEPAAQQVAAEEPAVQQVAAEEPAVQQVAAEEPAAQQVAAEEPVTGAPATAQGHAVEAATGGFPIIPAGSQVLAPPAGSSTEPAAIAAPPSAQALQEIPTPTVTERSVPFMPSDMSAVTSSAAAPAVPQAATAQDVPTTLSATPALVVPVPGPVSASLSEQAVSHQAVPDLGAPVSGHPAAEYTGQLEPQATPEPLTDTAMTGGAVAPAAATTSPGLESMAVPLPAATGSMADTIEGTSAHDLQVPVVSTTAVPEVSPVTAVGSDPGAAPASWVGGLTETDTLTAVPPAAVDATAAAAAAAVPVVVAATSPAEWVGGFDDDDDGSVFPAPAQAQVPVATPAVPLIPPQTAVDLTSRVPGFEDEMPAFSGDTEQATAFDAAMAQPSEAAAQPAQLSDAVAATVHEPMPSAVTNAFSTLVHELATPAAPATEPVATGPTTDITAVTVASSAPDAGVESAGTVLPSVVEGSAPSVESQVPALSHPSAVGSEASTVSSHYTPIPSITGLAISAALHDPSVIPQPPATHEAASTGLPSTAPAADTLPPQRVSPSSRTGSGGGAGSGRDTPGLAQRGSWRSSQVGTSLAGTDQDTLELSMAAAEALHAAQHAAAETTTTLFGIPPHPTYGEEEEEAVPVMPFASSTAGPFAAALGSHGADTLQQSHSARSLHNVDQRPSLSSQESRSSRVSRNASINAQSMRPPSPSLHTWQRDNFAHVSKRSSLELGIAAAEAAALAARATSRSSLDTPLGSGTWASTSGTGLDTLLGDTTAPPAMLGVHHAGRMPSRLSQNGLARVQEDESVPSSLMTTQTSITGAQLAHSVVMTSSLFGNTAAASLPVPPATVSDSGTPSAGARQQSGQGGHGDDLGAAADSGAQRLSVSMPGLTAPGLDAAETADAAGAAHGEAAAPPTQTDAALLSTAAASVDTTPATATAEAADSASAAAPSAAGGDSSAAAHLTSADADSDTWVMVDKEHAPAAEHHTSLTHPAVTATPEPQAPQETPAPTQHLASEVTAAVSPVMGSLVPGGTMSAEPQAAAADGSTVQHWQADPQPTTPESSAVPVATAAPVADMAPSAGWMTFDDTDDSPAFASMASTAPAAPWSEPPAPAVGAAVAGGFEEDAFGEPAFGGSTAVAAPPPEAAIAPVFAPAPDTATSSAPGVAPVGFSGAASAFEDMAFPAPDPVQATISVTQPGAAVGEYSTVAGPDVTSPPEAAPQAAPTPAPDAVATAQPLGQGQVGAVAGASAAAVAAVAAVGAAAGAAAGVVAPTSSLPTSPAVSAPSSTGGSVTGATTQSPSVATPGVPPPRPKPVLRRPPPRPGAPPSTPASATSATTTPDALSPVQTQPAGATSIPPQQVSDSGPAVSQLPPTHVPDSAARSLDMSGQPTTVTTPTVTTTPPPAYDTAVAALTTPPPAYDSVVVAPSTQATAAAAPPPPPAYDSLYPAATTAATSGAPPPPAYDTLYGSTTATEVAPPPPPAYDTLYGAGTPAADQTPPPPPYDAVYGSAPAPAEPPPPAYDTLYAGEQPRSTTAPASDPEAPQEPPPPAYDALYGQAIPVTQAGGAGMVLSSEPRGGAVSKPPLATPTVGAAVPVPVDQGAQGAAQFKDPETSHDEQLCVEVRLPPMFPKKAVLPKRLEAGFGSLYAAPGPAGKAMLQWSGADSAELGVPQGLTRATEEDPDSTPCGCVPSPDATQSQVTALLMDEVSGNMWAGHEDGRVSRWSVGVGRGPRCEQVFKAHSDNKIRCLCLTPWGDLWTGNTSGVIRVWAHPGGVLGTRSPPQALEPRRPGGGRPHGKVLTLTTSSTGNTVWSAGMSHLLIWDAYTGSCLGGIRLGSDLTGGFTDDEGMLWIDPRKGIDHKTVRAQFKQRDTTTEQSANSFSEAGAAGSGGGAGGEFAPGEEDPTPQATKLQQVAKKMSGVAKFAAKLGKKINKTAAAVTKNIQDMDRGGGRGKDQSESDSEAQTQDAKTQRGKVKAVLATLDHAIIVIYKTGLVDRFSEYGHLEWTQDARAQLTCGVALGRSLWVGGTDGQIRVFDVVTGARQACWPAHLATVKSLSVVQGVVYSLGKDGSIKGWPALQPPPPECIAAWKGAIRQGLSHRKLKVLAGTWNVNTTKATIQSIHEWLGRRAEEADVVCVGLQEVEMGTSSVAFDAAKAVLNKAALERGTSAGQWWAETLLQILGGPNSFSRVGLRQMAGILVVVFVKKDLEPFVGEVVTDNVACGVYGVGGNKGAVAVCMTLHRRRLVFMSAHFSAHQENVRHRNADYAKIVRGMRFFVSDTTGHTPSAPHNQSHTTQDVTLKGPPRPRFPKSVPSSALAPKLATENPEAFDHSESESDGSESGSEAEDVAAGGSGLDRVTSSTPMNLGSPPSSHPAYAPPSIMAKDNVGLGMLSADMLIWMGDFNYRIHAPYGFVVDHVERESLSELVMMDQARQEMAKGIIFHGLSEGPLSFPPTYKFDKGPACGVYENGTPQPTYQGVIMPYDSSEKRRIPAWTDRIFFRGSLLPYGCTGPRDEDAQLYLAAVEEPYGTVLKVVDSDHKPVYADLDLILPVFDQQHKRSVSMQIIRTLLSGIVPAEPPATTLELSPTQKAQQPQGAGIPVVTMVGEHRDGIMIHNMGPTMTHFHIGGDGNPRHRLPSWLDISPISGVLMPGAHAIIGMRGAVPDDTPPPQQHSQQYSTVTPPRAPRVETLVRVFVQHIVSNGTGSISTLAPNTQPLLVKVVHNLQ